MKRLLITLALEAMLVKITLRASVTRQGNRIKLFPHRVA